MSADEHRHHDDCPCKRGVGVSLHTAASLLQYAALQGLISPHSSTPLITEDAIATYGSYPCAPAFQPWLLGRASGSGGKDININKADEYGHTALHQICSALLPTADIAVAARKCCMLLLACGADPNASVSGLTPLHRAAVRGDTIIVAMLLNAGAKTESTDEASGDGKTPLAKAVSAGQMQVVELLLKAGANPFAVDNKSRSVLDLANAESDIHSLVQAARETFSSVGGTSVESQTGAAALVDVHGMRLASQLHTGSNLGSGEASAGQRGMVAHVKLEHLVPASREILVPVATGRVGTGCTVCGKEVLAAQLVPPHKLPAHCSIDARVETGLSVCLSCVRRLRIKP